MRSRAVDDRANILAGALAEQQLLQSISQLFTDGGIARGKCGQRGVMIELSGSGLVP